jgi:hypothetical protein
MTPAERYPNTESRSADWQSYTHIRLAWAHGPERAAAIIEGRDPQTEADLAAWRSLGRRAAP